MATYDITTQSINFNNLNKGDIINCPYSGTIKSITLPKGTYKFELWGGGSPAAGSDDNLAYGGYTQGLYTVNQSTTFYLVCGGSGVKVSSAGTRLAGGYNGGGSGNRNSKFSVSSGGGATHIALAPGLLTTFENNKSSVIAVAGGAGGGVNNSSVYHGVCNSSNYGGGGGLSGKDGDTYSTGSASKTNATGGTQISGGTGAYVQGGAYSIYGRAGGFGYGGAGGDDGEDDDDNSAWGAGGGSGWYGGGGGGSISAVYGKCYAGGAGGSGYKDPLTNGTTDYQTSASPSGSSLNGYIRITIIKLFVTPPTLTSSNNFTYETNALRTLSFNNPDSSLLSIQGTVSAINAGTYNYKFVLNNKNFVWLDTDDNADKEFSWTIEKQTVNVPITSAPIYTFSGNFLPNDLETNELYTSTCNIEYRDVGVYGENDTIDEKITISLVDQSNYKWSDTLNSTDRSFSWSIVKKEIELPTWKNGELRYTYNGLAQGPSIEDIDYDTDWSDCSDLGDKQVNQNTYPTEQQNYKVKFDLKEPNNLKWKDMTTNESSPYYLYWYIEPKKVQKPKEGELLNTKDFSIQKFSSESYYAKEYDGNSYRVINDYNEDDYTVTIKDANTNDRIAGIEIKDAKNIYKNSENYYKVSIALKNTDGKHNRVWNSEPLSTNNIYYHFVITPLILGWPIFKNYPMTVDGIEEYYPKYKFTGKKYTISEDEIVYDKKSNGRLPFNYYSSDYVEIDTTDMSSSKPGEHTIKFKIKDKNYVWGTDKNRNYESNDIYSNDSDIKLIWEISNLIQDNYKLVPYIRYRDTNGNVKWERLGANNN